MHKILFILFCSVHLFAEIPRIMPPALEKGDLIALVFPASYLDKSKEEAQEVVRRKAAWLKRQGYRTILYPEKVHIYGYLAGTDKERAQALMSAWKNPEVKMIWSFRGGYGTPRILDLLDYEWIKEHPKIFVGMSDITALHHAIQQKTGLVTFLGPVVNYFDEKDNNFDPEYALAEMERVLVQKKKGEIPIPTTVKVINAGKAQGRLVGGNLSLIAALCGTKWQLNTDNKILVLEDVGEESYRLDRLLWQLQEAGLLKKPAAVILGNYIDCASKLKHNLSLQQVFNHYFRKAPYPVIYDFPTGHDKYQATLPLNITAEVDTENLKIKLLESAVK